MGDSPSLRNVPFTLNAQAIHESQLNLSSHFQPEYKLYKRRWAILFAIYIFGFLGSLASETGPLLHTMMDLLDLSLDQTIYISQLFGYLTLFTTAPIGWLIDRYGLRYSMYVATGFVIVRNLCTALMYNTTLPGWKTYRRVYWIIGGLMGAKATSIYYCMPLKISENWFGENERSLAWTLMITSSNIGSCIICFLLPRIVFKVEDLKPMFYVNIVCAIVTTLAVFLCITRSKPPSPPAERTTKANLVKQMSYWNAIRAMFASKQLVFHMFHVIIFEAAYYSLIAFTQDILMNSGHTNVFVGDLFALNSVASIVLVVGLGSQVHRVQNIVLACKIASIIKTIALILNLVTMLYPVPEWLVVVCSILYIGVRSWTMPNFNNMSAHLASGTVPEATSSGVAVTLVMLFINLSQVGILQFIRKTPKGNNYDNSILLICSICIVNTLIYAIFFTGSRREKEMLRNEIQGPQD